MPQDYPFAVGMKFCNSQPFTLDGHRESCAEAHRGHRGVTRDFQSENLLQICIATVPDAWHFNDMLHGDDSTFDCASF